MGVVWVVAIRGVEVVVLVSVTTTGCAPGPTNSTAATSSSSGSTSTTTAAPSRASSPRSRGHMRHKGPQLLALMDHLYPIPPTATTAAAAAPRSAPWSRGRSRPSSRPRRRRPGPHHPCSCDARGPTPSESAVQTPTAHTPARGAASVGAVGRPTPTHTTGQRKGRPMRRATANGAATMDARGVTMPTTAITATATAVTASHATCRPHRHIRRQRAEGAMRGPRGRLGDGHDRRRVRYARGRAGGGRVAGVVG